MSDKTDKDRQDKQAEAMDAFAAAAAVGFAVASRTMEMWFGAMSGFARASREIVAPHLEEQNREGSEAQAPVMKAERSVATAQPDAKPAVAPKARVTKSSAPVKKESETVRPTSGGRAPKAFERPEVVDDLKLITGIGPKLEQVLNGLGVWTVAQVAAWQPEEIAWVDDLLGLNGRIEHDKWLEQAASLEQAGMQKRDVAAG